MSLLRKQQSRLLGPQKSPSAGLATPNRPLDGQGRGKNGGARLSCPTDLTSRSLQGFRTMWRYNAHGGEKRGMQTGRLRYKRPPHPAWPSAKPSVRPASRRPGERQAWRGTPVVPDGPDKQVPPCGPPHPACCAARPPSPGERRTGFLLTQE